MGVAPFQGAFREFEATLDEQGVRGVAQASSIDVDNADLTAHLASPDFFDVANHPDALLRDRRARARRRHVTATASSWSRAIARRSRSPAPSPTPSSDPWGGRKLGLSLSGTVDRNAVGLTWNAPLPEGGSMLADEVELTATLVLRPGPRGGLTDADPRHPGQPPGRLAQPAAPPPRRRRSCPRASSSTSTTGSRRSRPTTRTSTTSSRVRSSASRTRSRRPTRSSSRRPSSTGRSPAS